MLFPQLVPTLLVLASAAVAAPIFGRQSGVSTLSASAKAEVAVFADLTRLSYCSAALIKSGAAGGNTFTSIAAGGNDQAVPGWYVAYSSSLKAIIVGHQGTNGQSLISVGGILNVGPSALPEARFPGAGAAGVRVHTGFQNAQASTAAEILAAVKTGTAQYSTNKVITVGHSLGGAIAELDAIYLKLQIPSLSVSARLFGLPQVGNAAFASFAGRVVPDSTHVNNKQDPVPALPGRALGFTQIAGEIYITPAGVYQSCSGIDNAACAAGKSGSNVNDHGGPYNGISMGPEYCSL